MDRVPLGELPFKQKNGELLRKRVRIFRPLPSCEAEDRENSGAALYAAQENVKTLGEIMVEQMRHDIDSLVATLAEGPPRLSMPPVDYDGSSSEPEPDDSILNGRARPMPALAQAAAMADHIDASFNGNHAAEEENTGVDQQSVSAEEYDDDTEEEEDDEDDEEQAQDIAPLFDPATAGLKEISNLARFTVSSHKPGNGVEELKSDDLKQFWQ